jgi:CRISPR-associated Cas5-like protein
LEGGGLACLKVDPIIPAVSFYIDIRERFSWRRPRKTGYYKSYSTPPMKTKFGNGGPVHAFPVYAISANDSILPVVLVAVLAVSPEEGRTVSVSSVIQVSSHLFSVY